MSEVLGEVGDEVHAGDGVIVALGPGGVGCEVCVPDHCGACFGEDFESVLEGLGGVGGFFGGRFVEDVLGDADSFACEGGEGAGCWVVGDAVREGRGRGVGVVGVWSCDHL